MKEFESFDRIGTMPHRSYYIPFASNDTVNTKYGITDRVSSSRFMSLDIAFSVPKGASCDASLDNMGYAVVACIF